jgi:hypothetical protein
LTTQFYVYTDPGGVRAFEACAGQVGAAQVEVCALQVCLVQPRVLQVRVAEVGTAQGSASEPRLSKVRLVLREEGWSQGKLVGVLLMMSMELNLMVDIGGFIDTKLERPRCHTSQLGERLDDDDVGFVDGRAEFSAATEPSATARRSGPSGSTCPGARPRRSRSSARREAHGQPMSADSAAAWASRKSMLPSSWGSTQASA